MFLPHVEKILIVMLIQGRGVCPAGGEELWAVGGGIEGTVGH